MFQKNRDIFFCLLGNILLMQSLNNINILPAANSGVIYKELLFDLRLCQKSNLGPKMSNLNFWQENLILLYFVMNAINVWLIHRGRHAF